MRILSRVSLLVGLSMGLAPGGRAQPCGGPPPGPLRSQFGTDFSIQITQVQAVVGEDSVRVRVNTNARRVGGWGPEVRLYRNLCLVAPNGNRIEAGVFPVGAGDSWSWPARIPGGVTRGEYTAYATVWGAEGGRNYTDATPENNTAVRSLNLTVDDPGAPSVEGPDYVFLNHEIVAQQGGRFQFVAQVRDNGTGGGPPGRIVWTVDEGLDQDGPLAERSFERLPQRWTRPISFTLDLNDYGPGPFGKIRGKVRIEAQDSNTANNEVSWGMDLEGGAVAPSLNISRPSLAMIQEPTREEPGSAVIEGLKIYNLGGAATKIFYQVVVLEPAGMAEQPVQEVPFPEKPSKEWGPLKAPAIDLGYCRERLAALKVKVVAWASFQESLAGGESREVTTPRTESGESDPLPLPLCPPECRPGDPDFPGCRRGPETIRE